MTARAAAVDPVALAVCEREAHRYVYLGDRFTDPALVGKPCDPVLRADGKCIVGRKPRNQLVRFADGREVVVLARRLRVAQAALIEQRQARLAGQGATR